MNTNKIRELLKVPSASARDMTSELKDIGDGNMLNGIKNIFGFAHKEGEKSGIIKGCGGTLIVVGIIHLIPKYKKFLKKKSDEKKAHDEIGKKIYALLNTENELNATKEDQILNSTEND